MTGAQDTILICASPRTGSTLLCGLLTASGMAGRAESWFRTEDRPDYAAEWGLSPDASFAEYLAHTRRAATSPNGVAAIRVMGETRPELLADLARLWPEADDTNRLARAFGRIAWVHLTRADRIAQAVSRVRADQTGLWHRFRDGEERDPGKSRRACYDRAAIARRLAEVEADAKGWADWFTSQAISPIRVRYEDLARAPEAEARRVLAELRLDPPPGVRLRTQNRRLSDRTSAGWIARFRGEADGLA